MVIRFDLIEYPRCNVVRHGDNDDDDYDDDYDDYNDDDVVDDIDNDGGESASNMSSFISRRIVSHFSLTVSNASSNSRNRLA